MWGVKFLPKSIFLRLKYWRYTHKKLNLKKPKTFTEKLQWLKLNDHRNIYTTMVDKIAAKEYVRGKVGPQYVLKTLGIWDSTDKIDVSSLPNQFVLKTTHGGGSGGVCIVKNKETYDFATGFEKLNNSLQTDISEDFKEWPYKNVPRRIIAEEFICQEGIGDLTDYKIFCFNGIPRYIQVIRDRNTDETIDFFDTDWNLQPFIGLNPAVVKKDLKNRKIIPQPENLSLMLDIAARLSEDIPFLRVDLYNIEGKIYFGEMTFYPGSGFGMFNPPEWDYKLGKLLKLPSNSK